jgi:DnaJ-class molecular chaperone
MPKSNTPPSEPAKSGLLRETTSTLEVNKTPDIKKHTESVRPCPTCKGKGYEHANTMIGDTMIQYEKRCWRCQGTKVVNGADDDD